MEGRKAVEGSMFDLQGLLITECHELKAALKMGKGWI